MAAGGKGAPILSRMGLLVPGNINLMNRPLVQNLDGTTSTVRSMSFGTDRGEVLIPTVVDGQVVSPAQAIRHYEKTGRHLGIFKTWQQADRYAESLHRSQEKLYGGRFGALNALLRNV